MILPWSLKQPAANVQVKVQCVLRNRDGPVDESHLAEFTLHCENLCL